MKIRCLTAMLLVFVLSCNEGGYTSDFLKYRIDSVTFQVSESAQIIRDGRNFIIDLVTTRTNSHSVVFYFPNSKRLYTCQLGNGRLVTSTKIGSGPNQDCYSFDLRSDSTLWFSTPNELIRTTMKTGVNGTCTYVFQPSLDSAFTIFSYLDNARLEIGDDSMFLQVMNSRSITDPELSLAEQYSAPCVGRFQIVSDTVRCIDTVAFFPSSYRRKFHYSRFPSTTISGDNVYYVFTDGDSVSAFDTRTKSRRNVVSLHSIASDYKPILMNKDSVFSIPYIIKNAIISPGVRLFQYDPYRNVFYLGLKKAESYLSADGSRINDLLDFPFRILVLDSQFKLIKAIDIPKGRFQALYHAFVAEKGLYLMLKNKNAITYEVYDFLGSGNY